MIMGYYGCSTRHNFQVLLLLLLLLTTIALWYMNHLDPIIGFSGIYPYYLWNDPANVHSIPIWILWNSWKFIWRPVEKLLGTYMAWWSARLLLASLHQFLGQLPPRPWVHMINLYPWLSSYRIRSLWILMYLWYPMYTYAYIHISNTPPSGTHNRSPAC